MQPSLLKDLDHHFPAPFSIRIPWQLFNLMSRQGDATLLYRTRDVELPAYKIIHQRQIPPKARLAIVQESLEGNLYCVLMVQVTNFPARTRTRIS